MTSLIIFQLPQNYYLGLKRAEQSFHVYVLSVVVVSVSDIVLTRLQCSVDPAPLVLLSSRPTILFLFTPFLWESVQV